eukprot:scaffold2258_cov144-Skeletonema_menzelii.AAC.11
MSIRRDTLMLCKELDAECSLEKESGRSKAATSTKMCRNRHSNVGSKYECTRTTQTETYQYVLSLSLLSLLISHMLAGQAGIMPPSQHHNVSQQLFELGVDVLCMKQPPPSSKQQ